MVRLISKLAINLLLLLSTPAMASIGSITEFKGAGQVKRAAKAIPAAKGAKVEKNDTVTTNSQGRFRITFVDSTTVNITENSRLVIDDFVFDGGGKAKGKLGLKVALGTVRYASGKIAHGGGGVNIRTPTATIGVRGTDFVMSVDEIGRTMIVLLPNCFDEKDPSKVVGDCPTGAIDVTTPSGTVTLDKPFQATVVESAQTPPSTPVTVSLDGKAINNSLQIAAPKTESGASLVQAARDDVKQQTNPAAAAADSNASVDVGVDDSGGGQEVTAQITQQVVEEAAPAVAVEQMIVQTQVYIEPPVTVIQTSPVTEKEEEKIEFIKPVYNKTAIIGWEAIAITKTQEAEIILPKDTNTLISLTQDNVTQQYNFNGHNWPNSGYGQPTGYIVIVQTSAP